VETISFWTKKLAFLPGKSQFSEAYEDLKKMKVDLPKNYEFYKSEKLALGLWGDREDASEEFIKNEEMSPLISELSAKFNDCKAHIEEKINEAVLNEEEIYLKSIVEKLRDFLLAFFSKYKSLEVEATIDRDVLVVYFHIINTLFKRISSKFYIPVQEMITLTK
jgi:predicted AlkP superfamily phosphohydrolase/phosphomutase